MVILITPTETTYLFFHNFFFNATSSSTLVGAVTITGERYNNTKVSAAIAGADDHLGCISDIICFCFNGSNIEVFQILNSYWLVCKRVAVTI